MCSENMSSLILFFSRWEDEVKKEVPVPECLAKDSSEYTDEDVMVIASYESKVQALQEERERYKARLQAEIAETRGQSNRSRK